MEVRILFGLVNLPLNRFWMHVSVALRLSFLHLIRHFSSMGVACWHFEVDFRLDTFVQ